MDTMTEYWTNVEEAVETARLIAWDTCHKIYLAMDEEQEAWFTENGYPEIFRGTPREMLTKAQSWYAQACPLRFVSAVSTRSGSEVFSDLIPQGADWNDEEEW